MNLDHKSVPKREQSAGRSSQRLKAASFACHQSHVALAPCITNKLDFALGLLSEGLNFAGQMRILPNLGLRCHQKAVFPGAGISHSAHSCRGNGIMQNGSSENVLFILPQFRRELVPVPLCRGLLCLICGCRTEKVLRSACGEQITQI
jgi:hypothetical protein